MPRFESQRGAWGKNKGRGKYGKDSKGYDFDERRANEPQSSMSTTLTGAGMVGNVQCRNVSCVQCVAVLLGSANALTYSQNHLYIDGWLPLRCTFETAAIIGALKACLESLVLRLAHTPALVTKNDAPLLELKEMLAMVVNSEVRIEPEVENIF